jgi:hypothetical protein
MMPGSMRRRGENSWQLRVYVGRDPKSGRKRYTERTFHGGQRQAGRALAALAIEVERLTPRTASEGTMEALFNEWLAHAAQSFSPKTIDNDPRLSEQAHHPGSGGSPGVQDHHCRPRSLLPEPP